ncbi:MAG: hypothetical protein R3F56_09900 [Planctomycetota bacterium]
MQRPSSLARLPAFLLLMAPLTAQGTVLADLNQTPTGSTVGSSAREFTQSGGSVWFAAHTRPFGLELWRYAGSTPVLEADVWPGPDASNPRSLTPFQNGVVFFANTATGSTLFRVAGPGQAPVRLLPAGVTPQQMLDVGADIYFTATDAAHGIELWVSQGNAGDARLVADILPGPGTSAITRMTRLGSRVVFFANDGPHGYEWWASDGTTAGTVMLGDLNPGSGHGATLVTPLVMGGLAYLSGDDGVHGYEMWSTDGTPGSLQLVVDIFPGATGSNPHDFTPIGGGRFLFGALGSLAIGDELWISDGTAAGTQMVADIYTGSIGSAPSQMTPVPGGVYFIAATASGIDLAFSDGTAAGTLVIDTVPSTYSGFTSLTALGQRVMFMTSRFPSDFIKQLIISDGTAAGTFALSTNALGSGIAVTGGGQAVFAANSTAEGIEPWITDGTVAATHLLADIETRGANESSTPYFVDSFGGRAIFLADDGTARRIYSSDGTAAGTSVLPMTAYRRLGELPLGLLLSDNTSVAFTDGTVARTATVLPQSALIQPGENVSPAALLDADHIVFSTSTGLWSSDGTAAGTVQFAPFTGGDFVAGGPGLVYFARPDASSTRRNTIWTTDGTALGTKPFFTQSPPTFFEVDIIGVIGGRLIYGASTNGQIFASDGTTAGTVALHTAQRSPFTVSPPARVGSRLVFSLPSETLATDGTPGGTEILLPTFSTGIRVLAFGDIGILAGSSSTRSGLWRTDGTAAGTLPIGPALSGVGAPSGTSLTQATESRALLVYNAGVVTTDGTGAGTLALTPTELASVPTGVATNGILFYTGNNAYEGREPYVTSFGAAAHRQGVGCADGAPPHLTANEPTIGQTLQLQLDSTAPLSAAMLGLPSPSPVRLPGPGCALWVDVASPFVVLALAGGSLSLPIPSGAGLENARLMVQAVAGPSSLPLGVDWSNALRLVLRS